ASVAYATGEAAALAAVSAKAVTLAEAGVRAMALAKIKIAATVAVCVVLFLGGSVMLVKKVATARSTTPATTSPMQPTRPEEPRLMVKFSETQRFGLVCTMLYDAGNPKRLTREANGTTNNTCFRLDGREYLYGITVPDVRWGRDKHNKIQKHVEIGKHRWQSVFEVWD